MASDPMDQFSTCLRQAFEQALSDIRQNPARSGVDIGFGPDGNLTVRKHFRTDGGLIGGFQLKPTAPPDRSNIMVINQNYDRDIGSKRHSHSLLLTWIDRRARQDPLRPGISVSGAGCPGGTIGAIVFDQAGAAYVLSSAHVLACGSGEAEAPPLVTVQPSATVASSVTATTVIGCLSDSLAADPRGDAATSKITVTDRARTYCRLTVGDEPGEGVVVGPPETVHVGDIVRKSGTATGVTTGKVDGIGHYFVDAGDAVGFRGFRVAKTASSPANVPLSAAGDSGAVWYNEPDAAGRGLHVAGTDSGQFSIACHLDAVMEALNVKLDPPAQTPPGLVACSDSAFQRFWRRIKALFRLTNDRRQ